MRTRVQRESGQIAVHVRAADTDDWRVWSTFTLDKTDALLQATRRARTLRSRGYHTRIIRPTEEDLT
jgi:hypothetical protein